MTRLSLSVVAALALSIVALAQNPGFPAEPETTNISTNLFRADLPGKWVKRDTANTLTYTQSQYRLTIEVKALSTEHDFRKLRPIVSQVIDDKRNSLQTASDNSATFERPLGEVKEPRTMFRFTGSDPHNRLRFFVGIVGLPKAVVTITVYGPLDSSYEALYSIGFRAYISVFSPPT